MKKTLFKINKFFQKYNFLLFLEDYYYFVLFAVFVIMFGAIGWAIIQCINFLLN